MSSIWENKALQGIIAAIAGTILGGGGMLQLGNRDMASVGSGVEEIIVANSKQMRLLFDELAECREEMRHHHDGEE